MIAGTQPTLDAALLDLAQQRTILILLHARETVCLIRYRALANGDAETVQMADETLVTIGTAIAEVEQGR